MKVHQLGSWPRHATDGLIPSVRQLPLRFAGMCLSVIMLSASGCATKMAVTPQLRSAEVQPDFRVPGRIIYEGNRDYLPRTITGDAGTNVNLVFEYSYQVVYGRDKTPQAIPLFNPLTIVGFPIGENTLVIHGRLKISDGAQMLKDYTSTCGIERARSVFSEGDTFSAMRRKGLMAVRDNIELQMYQDREWFANLPVPR